MHWDGYTVCSVLSGALLIIMGLVMSSLKAGRRAGSILFGAALIAYAIYVAKQTSGTYYFPFYIFVVPIASFVTMLHALARETRPRAPQQARTASAHLTRRPPAFSPKTPSPAVAPSTSFTCPSCGATGPVANPASLRWTCPSCGVETSFQHCRSCARANTRIVGPGPKSCSWCGTPLANTGRAASALTVAHAARGQRLAAATAASAPGPASQLLS